VRRSRARKKRAPKTIRRIEIVTDRASITDAPIRTAETPHNQNAVTTVAAAQTGIARVAGQRNPTSKTKDSKMGSVATNVKSSSPGDGVNQKFELVLRAWGSIRYLRIDPVVAMRDERARGNWEQVQP